MEIKRLEQVEKRYRSDRDDLMRTVMGLDSGLVELDQDHTEAILGVDKVRATSRVSSLTSRQKSEKELTKISRRAQRLTPRSKKRTLHMVSIR